MCPCVTGYRFIGWDPDNVSYWVALLFTLGSVAWVINGFYLFLPTGNTAVDLYASGYSGALVQLLLPLEKSRLDCMCAVCCALKHISLRGGHTRVVGIPVWACMHHRRVSRSSIHLSKWTRCSVC